MRFFLAVLILITAACSSPQADSTPEPSRPAALPTADTVGRPWFGIGFNQQLEDRLVLFVDPGGPADRAGIQTDDVLLALDGEPVTADTLVERFSLYRPGDTLRVTVERGDEPLDFQVTLGVLPTGAPQESRIISQNFIGFIIEITDAEVIVIDIVAGSPAAEAGIVLGDVILAVNDVPLEDPQQIFDLLEPVIPGVSVPLTLNRQGETVDVMLEVPALPLAPPTPTAGAGSPEEAVDRLSYQPNRNLWVVENIVPVGILGSVGLQVGDVIVSLRIGDRQFSQQTLQQFLNTISPEDEVMLTVQRGDEIIELSGPGVLAPAVLAAAERTETQVEPTQAPAALIPAGAAYGFTALPVTAQIAAQAGLQAGEGLVVIQVQPGTPAAQAGLRSNDVITAVNGRPVTSDDPFDEQLAVYNGETVVLSVIRDGEVIDMSLTVIEPDATQPAAGPGALPFPLPILLTPEGS